MLHATNATLGRRAMLGAAVGLTAIVLSPIAARAQSAPAGAVAPIERMTAALLAAMKAGTATPFARRFDILAPAIDQAFDLQAVLRTSVGPRWDSLSPQAQQQLLDTFRRYTIANYVANFDSYSGQTVSISSQPRLVGAEAIVDTSINGGGSPVKLSYVMRNEGGTWRAVDVLADGAISRVAVQRSDFRHVLDNGGENALMASLSRKVSDLSGGQIA